MTSWPAAYCAASDGAGVRRPSPRLAAGYMSPLAQPSGLSPVGRTLPVSGWGRAVPDPPPATELCVPRHDSESAARPIGGGSTSAPLRGSVVHRGPQAPGGRAAPAGMVIMPFAAHKVFRQRPRPVSTPERPSRASTPGTPRTRRDHQTLAGPPRTTMFVGAREVSYSK